MSLLGKQWVIKNDAPNKQTIEKILENRGVKDINEDLKLHNPYFFKDMELAVERIKKAISDQERIMIFGDYDVDGISSTAIVFKTLEKLGAQVSYRLPHRMDDGYGLSDKFIDEFIERDVGLLITVDCGISNAGEIQKAKDGGVDVIITDHHAVPESFPDAAYAIIHPNLPGGNYPFKDLAGAGVALKLSQALLDDDEFFQEMVNLASLGTVADLVPLRGENRYIVKQGLSMMKNTNSAGLRHLLGLAAVKKEDILDSFSIGFRLAPRLNAAGRIGNPYLALKLLLHQEQNEELNIIGQKLEDLNLQRKEMTQEAYDSVVAHFSAREKTPHILIAESPDWHVGILGLIAGRLSDKFNRPTIIMQDFGDVLVASARSGSNFDITEALNNFSKYLLTFGGHKQAAGFNLKKENLAAFKQAVTDYAAEKLQDQELTPTLEIDCEIPIEEVSFDFLEALEELEPFGIGNQKPSFLIKNLQPQFIKQVGAQNNHLKFNVNINNQDLQVIGFGLGEFAPQLREHKNIDFVCHLKKNLWNNKQFLQLQALDIRKAEQ